MKNRFTPDSNDNTLFVTGQCNNRCLMCSQPPSNKEDSEFWFHKNLDILNNSPCTPPVIGITGGEPTMAMDKLFNLIELIQERFPETQIHLLTNGRAFSNIEYTKQFQKFHLEKILFAIPFHSDYAGDFDYITQIRGSFTETLLGIYNLARLNANVEIRIVVHELNYIRLLKMAEYIFRNFPFAEHIAFMGMENTGSAILNKAILDIDPFCYQDELEMAVLYLANWGMYVSVYNIPLCVLKNSLHSFSRQSISDWKVIFLESCTNCIMKPKCCGLFKTSKWQSQNVHSILNVTERT